MQNTSKMIETSGAKSDKIFEHRIALGGCVRQNCSKRPMPWLDNWISAQRCETAACLLESFGDPEIPEGDRQST